MKRGWTRMGAVLALAVFIPIGAVGCFGKFQLTRNVYEFNKDIHPDKWVVWAAFLVMNVVPIYGVSFFIDAIVANSFEFWTGDNPIKPSRTALGPNGERIEMALLDDGRIRTCIEPATGTATCIFLERAADAVLAYDADGRLIGRVFERDGRPVYSGT